MKTLTDIELLIVARAIGNSTNVSLRVLVNDNSKHNGGDEASITDAAVRSYTIWKKLITMLYDRGIDRDTGLKTETIKTTTKLAGIL